MSSLVGRRVIEMPGANVYNDLPRRTGTITQVAEYGCFPISIQWDGESTVHVNGFRPPETTTWYSLLPLEPTVDEWAEELVLG